MNSIRTAVFPVAGLGTRFLPATKASPKEMLVVGDMPLIHHAVREALDSGIERFIFITSQGKASIEDHFDVNEMLEAALLSQGKTEALEKSRQAQLAPGQGIFIRQQRPLGLGHAVWCARHLLVDEPFALLLADDWISSPRPCLSQLMEVYQHQGPGNYAAVMTVDLDHVSRYGILDPIDSEEGTPSSLSVIKARKVVEKPSPKEAPSQLAIVGRYILSPEIFHHIEIHKRGVGQEIQLTDAFNPLIQEGIPFSGVLFEGERFDCGTKGGWLEANLAYAYQDPELKPLLLHSIRKYL